MAVSAVARRWISLPEQTMWWCSRPLNRVGVAADPPAGGFTRFPAARQNRDRVRQNATVRVRNGDRRAFISDESGAIAKAAVTA
jgi:hypothetical protein